MIIESILILVWIIAALVEGRRDGVFFHNRNNSTKPDRKNIHWLFTVERALILVPICWIHSVYNCMLGTGVFGLSLIMVFSFLHNGMYYATRNTLDKNVYPKRWWDTSTTSESIFEFTPLPRTFLAIVGAIGIIASLTL